MTEEKQLVVVSDGDELQYLSNFLYDIAYNKNFGFLQNIYGHMIPTGMHQYYKTFFDFEKENAKDYGVKKERILKSMLDLYGLISKSVEEEYGVDLRMPAYEEEIRKFALIPFDFTRMVWIPGAKDVSRFLNPKTNPKIHKLCLLSSYDNSVWPDKKRFLGVNEFFDDENIHVPEFGKTSEDFIIASGWTKELDSKFKWITMGNGASDMKPALDISENWHGWYVRRASTNPYFENASSDFIPPPMNHPRVTNLTKITEILEHI